MDKITVYTTGMIQKSHWIVSNVPDAGGNIMTEETRMMLQEMLDCWAMMSQERDTIARLRARVEELERERDLWMQAAEVGRDLLGANFARLRHDCIAAADACDLAIHALSDEGRATAEGE